MKEFLWMFLFAIIGTITVVFALSQCILPMFISLFLGFMK